MKVKYIVTSKREGYPFPLDRIVTTQDSYEDAVTYCVKTLADILKNNSLLQDLNYRVEFPSGLWIFYKEGGLTRLREEARWIATRIESAKPYHTTPWILSQYEPFNEGDSEELKLTRSYHDIPNINEISGHTYATFRLKAKRSERITGVYPPAYNLLITPSIVSEIEID